MAQKNKDGWTGPQTRPGLDNAAVQSTQGKSTLARLLDYTRLPALWKPGAKTLVSTDSLAGQLDLGRFLIDSKTSGVEIDPRKLGVACVGFEGRNSDFLLVHQGLEIGGVKYDLYGIFDGVGNIMHGSRMIKPSYSHLVSKKIAEWLDSKLASSLENPRDALKTAIDDINYAVCNSNLKEDGFSTATVVLVNPQRKTGILLQVGNTQAYFVRKKGIEPLTEDGLLYLPADSKRQTYLTSVLGTPGMKSNIKDLEFHKPGFLMLTTAGVHAHIKREEMQNTVLQNKKDLNAAAGMLVSKARKNVSPDVKPEDASVVIARIR